MPVTRGLVRERCEAGAGRDFERAISFEFSQQPRTATFKEKRTRTDAEVWQREAADGSTATRECELLSPNQTLQATAVRLFPGYGSVNVTRKRRSKQCVCSAAVPELCSR